MMNKDKRSYEEGKSSGEICLLAKIVIHKYNY